MAYVVKWKGESTRLNYLVDVGTPREMPTWARRQKHARRFETKDQAIKHIRTGFEPDVRTWVDRGWVKIVRLIPRKPASSPPATTSPPSSTSG